MFLLAVNQAKFYNIGQKTLWSSFMDGGQLSQGYRATSRRQFAFTTKFPGISGTHLIGIGRMRSDSTFEPPCGFESGPHGLEIHCLNY